MPYYREYYDNDSTTHTVSSNGTLSEYPLVRDDAVMQSFRTRAHRNAFYAQEVPDITADPYAYFLDSTAKNRYRAALEERGFAAQGEPDRGHAFALSKYTLHGTDIRATRISKSLGSGEVTRIMDHAIYTPSSSSFGGIVPLKAQVNPASNLSTFAQQAYARVAPTSVVFDAAQFLGELREGLPHLIPSVLKSGAKVYKGLGSDYLNVEFGWKPFLNDLIKMGQALAGATNMLTGNGKRVHRRFGTPPVLSSTEYRTSQTGFTHWLGFPGLRESAFGLPTGPIGNGQAPSGTGYLLRTSSRSQWFEGEFTSFFKLGFDPSNFFDRLDALVNYKLTPSTLWELAPWSWLVDWHLRIGATIHANELAANDRLVMHYGYAMERTILRDLVSVEFSGNVTSKPAGNPSSYVYWPDLPASATWISQTDHKVRIRANPYGFRTGGTSALNSSQLAILGALGLTRLK